MLLHKVFCLRVMGVVKKNPLGRRLGVDGLDRGGGSGVARESFPAS